MALQSEPRADRDVAAHARAGAPRGIPVPARRGGRAGGSRRRPDDRPARPPRGARVGRARRAVPVGRRHPQRQLQPRRAAGARARTACSARSTTCPRSRAAATSAAGSRRGARARAAGRQARSVRADDAGGGRPRRGARRGPERARRLRRYIRFLDPHLSLRSVDVWTLGTIILRNLLLNWVVLVPLLAAAALLPAPLSRRAGAAVAARARVAGASRELVLPRLAGGRCRSSRIAALFAALELPSLGNRGHGQRAFLLWFLAPIVLGEAVISVHRYWAWRFGGGFSLRSVVLVSVVGMAVPWVDRRPVERAPVAAVDLARRGGRRRRRPDRDLVGESRA